MNKLLEKIYEEKDISTNVSIFVSVLVALLVYYLLEDSYLSFLILIGTFSLTKVLSQAILNKIYNKNKNINFFNDFSQTEKEAINIFIQKGVSSIIFSDINIDKHRDGFRSLEVRDKVTLINNPSSDPDAGPIGLELSEDVYKKFLEK